MATQVKKKVTEKNDILEKNTLNEEEVIKKETKQIEKKEEIKDNKVEDLEKEIENKNNEIKDLNDKFKLLQAQFELLMKASVNNNNNNTSAKDNENTTILVGCRLVDGGTLANNDETIKYKFDCDEEQYIYYNDLREILKASGVKNSKRLFEQDLFYFVDQKYYEEFKIKKVCDLSYDNVIRIINLQEEDMLREVEKVTDSKHNHNISFCFKYQIAKLLIREDTPLYNWSYNSRFRLEKYFNQKFDDLLSALGAVKYCTKTRTH